MQLQTQTPPIRGRRERREGEHTDPRPEAAERSLEEAVAEMRQQGAVEVADAKALIAQAHAAAEHARAETAKKDLAALEAEVDEAWGEFGNSTDEVIAQSTVHIPTEKDLEWDIPSSDSTESNEEVPLRTRVLEALTNSQTGKSFPEQFGSLIQHEEGLDALREYVAESITTHLLQSRISFRHLEQLTRLADFPKAKTEVIRELREHIGPVYAERLVTDAAYREALSHTQESLAQRISEDGPELCVETNIKQLILTQEMLGTQAKTVAVAANLAAYTPELTINTQKTKNVITILNPVFNSEKGTVSGKIVAAYVFNEGTNENPARIERTYELRQPREPSIPQERIGTLELIGLPNHLKGNGVAQQEMDTTENALTKANFDAVALHANIDIGGYAWAVKGYGWNFDAMRRTGEDEMDTMQILSAFIVDRLTTVIRNLRESDIDLEEISLQNIIAEVKLCVENPLAATPQHLAQIGKDGPRFIQGVSEVFYPEDKYTEAIKMEDPPRSDVKGAQHIGKMLLIGSDWYGRKSLKNE